MGSRLTKRFLADAVGCFVVISATLWVYLPTLSLPLWGDDAFHIYKLRDPVRAFHRLYDPAVSLDVNLFWFRPLADLSYTLDYYWWRLNPIGYHVHSLVLHCLVVTMLMWLLREWREERADCKPPHALAIWLIALSFSLNPIAAQTVGRPNMRYDLYATLLVFVSLWALQRWRREAWTPGRVVALVAAFGAFASKESAVVLLPLVFL